MTRVCSALLLVLAASAAPLGQQTYVIRGRVVAAEGGAPIRGALVSLPILNATITRTDENGRFDFLSEDPAPRFAISKTGFVLESVSGRSSSIEVKLQRGASLTVEAISPRGEPSAGAHIHVRCGNSGTGAPADDRGIRRIAYLPPGRCEVVAEDPTEPPVGPRRGATPAELKAALAAAREHEEERWKRAVKITLRRGDDATLKVEGPLPTPPIARRNAAPTALRRPTGTSTIEGRVVDVDGRPIEGAGVVLSIPVPVMVTGTDGTYTFADLPAGRYRVRAEKPGFVTREHGQNVQPNQPGTTITVADGQRLRDIDIMLPKGTVLSGRVLDMSGEPVAEAFVALVPAEGKRVIATPANSGGMIRTDDRGYYRMPGVTPGAYYIVAEPMKMPQPIRSSGQFGISQMVPSVERATLVDVPAGRDLENIDVTIDP